MTNSTITTSHAESIDHAEPIHARPELEDSPRRWVLVALLHVGMLVCYFHRGALSVAAPFMIEELGLSTAVMGVLLSAFFWPYSFMQTPAGWAVDRFGVRRVYALGFAVWSLAAAATGLARGLVTLFLARVFLGVGQAPIFPAHARAVANSFSARERGTAMAFANASSRLGQALVNGAGPLMIAAVGWKSFFFTTGLAPLLWLLPWLKFMNKWERAAYETSTQASTGASPAASAGARQEMSLIGSFTLLRQRSMVGVLLGFSAHNYAWILLYTWLPGYLKLERGFSTKEMALFSSIPFLAGFVIALFAGFLADWIIRRGHDELRVRKTFMTVAMGIGCLVIPAGMVADRMASVWLIIVALCGLSVSGITCWPLTQAVCEKKIVGTASGLQNFAGNMAGIIAPVLTGYIAHRTGSFALALGITGGILIGGILAYLLMVSERVEMASISTR